MTCRLLDACVSDPARTDDGIVAKPLYVRCMFATAADRALICVNEFDVSANAFAPLRSGRPQVWPATMHARARHRLRLGREPLKYGAERYGISGVGTAVSDEQLMLGRELCRGLPIAIRLEDYRDANN